MKSLKGTETHTNLMRAFASESQARNRYTIYAEEAKKEGYPLIQQLFEKTSDQEQAHGKVFYEYLAKEFNGQHIEIHADYPVDFYHENTHENLKASINSEGHEHNVVYPTFAETARREGLVKIAEHFEMIAEIENEHKRKFVEVLTQLENKTLFKKSEPVAWECQICGHIHFGVAAPTLCGVCSHPKGHFQEAQLPAKVLEKIKEDAKKS